METLNLNALTKRYPGILENIFLQMSPAEVEKCRLVCKDWNGLIANSLYKRERCLAAIKRNSSARAWTDMDRNLTVHNLSGNIGVRPRKSMIYAFHYDSDSKIFAYIFGMGKATLIGDQYCQLFRLRISKNWKFLKLIRFKTGHHGMLNLPTEFREPNQFGFFKDFPLTRIQEFLLIPSLQGIISLSLKTLKQNSLNLGNPNNARIFPAKHVGPYAVHSFSWDSIKPVSNCLTLHTINDIRIKVASSFCRKIELPEALSCPPQEVHNWLISSWPHCKENIFQIYKKCPTRRHILRLELDTAAEPALKQETWTSIPLPKNFSAVFGGRVEVVHVLKEFVLFFFRTGSAIFIGCWEPSSQRYLSGLDLHPNPAMLFKLEAVFTILDNQVMVQVNMKRKLDTEFCHMALFYFIDVEKANNRIKVVKRLRLKFKNPMRYYSKYSTIKAQLSADKSHLIAFEAYQPKTLETLHCISLKKVGPGGSEKEKSLWHQWPSFFGPQLAVDMSSRKLEPREKQSLKRAAALPFEPDFGNKQARIEALIKITGTMLR